MFAIKYERQRKKYLHRLKLIKYHLGPPLPPKKTYFRYPKGSPIRIGLGNEIVRKNEASL